MKKKRWNPIRGSGWQKIFFMMRVTVFILFAGLLQVSAAMAIERTAPIVVNTSAEQQKISLSGTVKDGKGIPIPGVTVIVKGTSVGTITDVNGQFRLSVPPDAKTLAFSFIGMETKEISIAGKTTFVILLSESTAALDEVVIVGYGVQKKESVVGAISQVKNEQLKRTGGGCHRFKTSLNR